MLKKLHTGVKVHFEVNGVQKVINSTIGGKQGDLLFPDLFNLHICAIMQIWRQRGEWERTTWERAYTVIQSCTERATLI